MYNSKQIPVFRYTFIGAKQYYANRALEICFQRHSSLRADKVTPFYLHPVAVASYLLTLSPSFMFVEETLVAALLHDTVEDTDIGIKDLRDMLLFGVPKSNKFDTEIAMTAISYLSKNLQNSTTYFEQISSHPVASLIKPADRINNFQSMVDVFSTAKQSKYIQEANESIIPAMKESRRLFPSQQYAYENMKLILNSQIELINKLLNNAKPISKVACPD